MSRRRDHLLLGEFQGLKTPETSSEWKIDVTGGRVHSKSEERRHDPRIKRREAKNEGMTPES
jgi:hypothetical protein